MNNINIHTAEVPTVQLSDNEDKITITFEEGTIILPTPQIDPFIRALMTVRAMYRYQ